MTDKILSDILQELQAFMPEEKAMEFATQLIGVGAATAILRKETLPAVAEVITRKHEAERARQ